MLAISAATGLLIALAAVVGIGLGCFFVAYIRRVPPRVQKDRDLRIAKETARRTFEATLNELVGPPHRG